MAMRPKSATVQLKVRLKEPLRARIEVAAKGNGVSMNAEIGDRLRGSFDREDLLATVRRVMSETRTA